MLVAVTTDIAKVRPSSDSFRGRLSTPFAALPSAGGSCPDLPLTSSSSRTAAANRKAPPRFAPEAGGKRQPRPVETMGLDVEHCPERTRRRGRSPGSAAHRCRSRRRMTPRKNPPFGSGQVTWRPARGAAPLEHGRSLIAARSRTTGFSTPAARSRRRIADRSNWCRDRPTAWRFRDGRRAPARP